MTRTRKTETPTPQAARAETAAAEAAALDPRGIVMEIPLDRLKKSPRNARRTPHSLEALQALAGSIAAKTLIHFPTVEPELDEAGEGTGCFLVTIGEGRRLALNLLAQRGTIAPDAPIRCVVNAAHDALEISLDENVTRTDMHPADQFEAFRELAETRGLGPEEIGARFGVSAHVVRQRLRLGAVSPKLMALYREDQLTVDQLMAFGISEDHARQEQVYEGLAWNKSPALIRRAMTERKVAADDRRARFVGAEAYQEAGGSILRDLFTEDGGGWFEDVALLDRLTAEKLDAAARGVRDKEGWKWAQAHLDFPYAHALTRLYPRPVERPAEDEAAIRALSEEYDTLTETWAEVEDLPPDIEARLKAIDEALEAWGDGSAYDADDIARGGVFVVLGHDAALRIERGFIRPEDVRRVEPEPDEDRDEEADAAPAGGDLDGPVERGREVVEDDEPDGQTPLPDRLVADLTAHRTAGLRDALAQTPDAALLAVIHALVVKTFYPALPAASCLDLRPVSSVLGRHAEGIEDGPASRRIAERHAGWARQLPRLPGEVWAFLIGLDVDSRLSLMAHCASLTVDAVRSWEARALALGHADDLAVMVGLDMAADWTATVRSYLGRVSKARILEAVREGVSVEAAERLAGLKKPDMAEAAEQAVAGTRWLPPLLRTAAPVEPEEAAAPVTAMAAE
ncbi:MAG TPA: ParB N-terminal domain-containing protein [Caulobacteraceae bacterium]|jgi:ParB family chromosome partitioning protein|nr:ParB N-terminal domain-containing protein [Caulobacteraceae bacterium]